MKEKGINIVKLINTSVGYSQHKPILSSINLEAKQGELIAVIGSNGSGKSTLLKSIANLLDTIDGNIIIKNKKLDLWERNEFAQMLSFVSTELLNVNNLKVEDLVSLGRFSYTGWLGKQKAIDKKIINKAIAQTGLEDFRNRFFNALSDGEKQRVMIARTLAQDTNIIILDEPTAFLDLPNKFEIIHLLHDLTRTENKTIIFSIHDLNIAIKNADKIWLIDKNTIHIGAPEDLILNNSFTKAFDNKKLMFDVLSGEFNVPVELVANICIKGNGPAYEWTKRALQRLRFNIDCNKNIDFVVKVIDINNELKWLVSEKEESILHNSIYELALYLRKNNF